MKPSACPLSSTLQKAIKRLKGTLRAPTKKIVFSTVKGDVELPPTLAWLHEVEWPPGATFQAKKPAIDPSSIEMSFAPISESYGTQFAKRPFAAVMYDAAQFYWLTALDENEPDPTVYHVDHGGQSLAAHPVALSDVLKKYVVELPSKTSGNTGKTGALVPDAGLREALERYGATMSKPSLARLDEIYLRDAVKDLSGIEYCTKLKSLHLLRSLRELDPSPLGKLAKLENIELQDVGELAWMATLSSLLRMNIKGDTYNPPFASLPQLEAVWLRWKSAPPSFDKLGVCLEQLELRGPNVVDAAAHVLPRLKKLKMLELEGQPLDDLRVLANCKNLWGIELTSNARDTSPLAKLNKVHNCRITGALPNLDFVTAWSDLNQLRLKKTEITSLAALAKTASDIVEVEGKFTDISPLAGTKRDELTLRSDELTDISPLVGTEILRLTLGGKRLTDLSPFAKAPEFTSLNLDDTAVTDVSPLFKNGVRNLWLPLSFTTYQQLEKIPGLTYACVRVPDGKKPPEDKKLANGAELSFRNSDA